MVDGHVNDHKAVSDRLADGSFAWPNLSDYGDMHESVARQADSFETLIERRVVMTCARRIGVPYSVARQMWEDPDDVAAELAWDAWLVHQQNKACGSCGVDPNDVQDPKSLRPLNDSAWKIVEHYCFTCHELRRLDDGLSEDLKKKGVHHRIVPANPGDPWIDYDHQLLASVEDDDL